MEKENVLKSQILKCLDVERRCSAAAISSVLPFEQCKLLTACLCASCAGVFVIYWL